jgi:hypothetical protein
MNSSDNVSRVASLIVASWANPENLGVPWDLIVVSLEWLETFEGYWLLSTEAAFVKVLRVSWEWLLVPRIVTRGELTKVVKGIDVVLKAFDVRSWKQCLVLEVSNLRNDVHTKVILINVILESRFMLELSILNIKSQLCLKKPIENKSNCAEYLILSINNMVNLIRTIIGGLVEVSDILFPLETRHRWAFVLHAELIFCAGAVDGRLFEETALVLSASTDSAGVFGRLVDNEMVLAKSNAQ